MRNLTITLALAAAVLFVGVSAHAVPIGAIVDGTNNTIYDGEHSGTGWYGAQEDQEVEVGSITGQFWDTEAIYFNANSLTLYIVAGFDFENGVTLGPDHVSAGDLFVTVNGTKYVYDLDRVGEPNASSNLAVTAGTGSYKLFVDNGNGLEFLNPTIPQHFIPSSPFAHNAVNDDTLLGTGNYQIYTGLTDDLGLVGGNHYVLELSLADLLGEGDSFDTHWTMECGNDVVKGHGRVPVIPEPATIALLGTGLAALGIARPRRRRA